MLKQVQICLVIGFLAMASTTQTWAGGGAGGAGGGIQNGCGDFGTIFYPKQAKMIILYLGHLPPLPERGATVHVAHQVYDVQGKLVSKGEYQSKYGIQTTSARFEVQIPDDQSTGWFNIHIQVLAKNNQGKILKQLKKTEIRMAVIPPPVEQDANTSYFGLGIPGKTSTPPLTERFVGPLQKLGVRWVKEFLQWRQVQPLAETPVDWRHHDHLVEVLTKAKIHLLFVLVSSPEFAATPRTPKTHPRAHNGAMPPKWNLWEKFVRQAVRRYRGKVHAWEVWNEANGGRAWGGTPESYVAFFKKTYAVIKEEDPNARVSMTGMTGVKAPWIARLGRAGAYPFMDIVNVHPYRYDFAPPEIGSPKAGVGYGRKPLVENLQAVVRTMDNMPPTRSGLKREFWCTESGFNTLPGVRQPLHQAVSLQEQAQYLVRDMLLARAVGVDRFFWWRMFDTYGMEMGLFRHQGYNFTPKPSFVAYAILERVTGRASDFSLLTDLPQNVYGCQWKTDRQRPGMALWTLKGTEKITLAATGPIKVINTMGVTRTLTPKGGQLELSLSPWPMYVLGHAKLR